MIQTFSPDEAQRLASTLLEWFEIHKRPLPWRQDYSPYKVWISEVMLQQTQMERGVAYFQRWMARFPSVASVAKADEGEILKYWEGLGYYRRARLLHQAAKTIVARHGGSLPENAEELRALPGLGEYTVAAILSIACRQDIVPVDANVERVFSRLLDIPVPVKKQPAASMIREAAHQLLPPGTAREYGQALMEFGALVCGRSPKCETCPLSAWCRAFRNGTQKDRPASSEKAATIPVFSCHGILICQKQVLLIQRPPDGLWGNMWEFPGGVFHGQTPRTALLDMMARLGLPCDIVAPLGTVSHGYTNHRLCAHFFRIELLEELSTEEIGCRLRNSTYRFLPWHTTGDVAMPAHHRKMAERYFSDKPRIHAEQLHL